VKAGDGLSTRKDFFSISGQIENDQEQCLQICLNGVVFLNSYQNYMHLPDPYNQGRIEKK